MTDTTKKKQLFFDFGRDYDASLKNFFFSSSNRVLKQYLDQFLETDSKSDAFFFGEKASGKTFLLNSIINENEKDHRKSLYIDLSKLNGDERYFQGLSSFNLICLDNIDQASSNTQIQVFNLINELKTSGSTLFICSTFSLQNINCFPDLQSRLSAMSAFHLKPIKNEEVEEVIMFVSSRLNLNFNLDLANYFARFIKRTFIEIKTSLTELDKFIYSEKRELSKKTLSEFLKKKSNL